MNLDLFKIDTLGSDGHGHLVSVTSTVVTIGGRLGVSYVIARMTY